MAIETISIKNFRNIKSSTLNLNKINIIYGINGSGKTSLLEAIFFLSRGKSFRTSKISNLINVSDKTFTLFTRSNNYQIGIQKNRSKNIQIKINHKYVNNLSSLSKYIAIQLISPECHLLVTGSPEFRRKYIDWLVFHVKHNLINLWKHHQKILKQRNFSLKNKLPKNQITIWDNELIKITNIINEERRQYIIEINNELNKLSSILFTEKYKFEIKYFQGWDNEQEFSVCLKNNFIKDFNKGFTSIGLNKSDIKIFVLLDGNKKVYANEYLSKGNIKLLSVILLIIQLKIFSNNLTEHPILLVDDIFAELDKNHIHNILELIFQLDLQLFLTTTALKQDQIYLPPIKNKNKLSMFHVKHGAIYPS